MATIYIGTVVSVSDDKDGERIRARILPVDKRLKDSQVPYAFPLLPKMIHIKPKVGEAVCIICQNDDAPRTQRFYIGPIISQPQFMYKEEAISSTSLLDGGVKKPDVSPSTLPESLGAYPKEEEIAICGRKNSDIILSDNDIRIRCGSHLVNENDKTDVKFNKSAPAYIKLKYHTEPLSKYSKKEYNSVIEETLAKNVSHIVNENEHSKTISTANVIADKINLISTNGSPYVDIADINEGISDEDMQKFIETAHQLPYGDILVNFLSLFLRMFKSHTHKYHNMPPCPDTESAKFDLAYSTTEEDLKDKLLSKDIRIN